MNKSLAAPASNTSANSAPAALLKHWGRLKRLPGGRWLFSRLIAHFVPYSGSIHADIVTLEPGHVILRLRERRRIRNHLHSVHAIALANLGELCSGLAMLAALPGHIQGIVTHLQIDYHKKARGLLIAESKVAIPEVNDTISHVVQATIRNAEGEDIASIAVTWSLRCRPPNNDQGPAA